MFTGGEVSGSSPFLYTRDDIDAWVARALRLGSQVVALPNVGVGGSLSC